MRTASLSSLLMVTGLVLPESLTCEEGPPTAREAVAPQPEQRAPRPERSR